MVADALPVDCELVTISTAGDRRRAAGDKSRFVKEIEDALLRREVDLAVHSAKDVPAELPEGLAIVGVPARADPRDRLLGAPSVEALPEGARVGTASLRRRAQLLALRPDLRVEELRGNVDTRLRRLAAGDFDAIVLAAAGLDRLGHAEGVPLAPEAMTPAPGQGCLALEARAGDAEIEAAAAGVTDAEALAALTAERALVAALGATCHTPVGAWARPDPDGLRLTAFAGSADGGTWIRDELAAPEARALGTAVGERMLAAGAGALVAET